MKIGFAFAVLAAILGMTNTAAAQQGFRGHERIRTFGEPRLGGYALDICPSDVGIEGLLRGRCGMPVANDFCRDHGFTEAVDAPQRGGLGPIRFLSGGIVTHPWATGFRYITCVG